MGWPDVGMQNRHRAKNLWVDLQKPPTGDPHKERGDFWIPHHRTMHQDRLGLGQRSGDIRIQANL